MTKTISLFFLLCCLFVFNKKSGGYLLLQSLCGYCWFFFHRKFSKIEAFRFLTYIGALYSGALLKQADVEK